MPLLENFEKQGAFLFKRRGTLPMIVVLMAFALVYADHTHFASKIHSSWFRWYEVFCLMISLTGLLIRILTVCYTPKGTSGRNTDSQVADCLNTSGMYSIVRHPLYLGNFLMWLGLALMTFHFWFTLVVCFIYWIYYERIMFVEEQFLRRKYSEEYLNWAFRTPTFFPTLYLWQKPKGIFSYKKVLRQEKNGFFALFLMFFLVDLIRMMDDVSSFFVDEWYWTAGLLVGAVIYLVLKVMKYKTKLLTESV